MKKLKILITNDDGIEGQGFKILKQRLEWDDHDIICLVPDRDCSAISHGMTIEKEMKFSDCGNNVYTLAGKPADCIISALRGNLFNGWIPDVVLSGINRGANLGTDVIYSGTVAAARQAVLYGIPGVALSLESYDGTWNYKPLADFAAKNLEKLMRLCACSSGSMASFVNVNAASTGSYPLAQMTRLSHREYNDKAVLNKETSFVKISGGVLETFALSDSDFAVSKSGKISVSTIHANPILAETVEEIDFIL